MSKREALSRYNLIVNRIRKSPASLKEIMTYLQRESELQGYNFEVSSRTFKRDLEDIWSLYKIDIQFDFSKKVYKINNEDQPDIHNRMLEAFDTFNALNVANGFSKYIHFESRKPQGTERFYGLLHAIKNSHVISFIYKKFWTDVVTERKVAPYALKEFKGRWYVLAKDEKDNRIKTFGLDRIEDLEITKKRFSYPSDLDIAELYKNSFGIINPIDGKPEELILSFDAEQGKYLKSFPLHNSQRIILDTVDELHISLKVLITHDLIMEILSYGDRVEVRKPESVKQSVINHYQRALAYYE